MGSGSSPWLRCYEPMNWPVLERVGTVELKCVHIVLFALFIFGKYNKKIIYIYFIVRIYRQEIVLAWSFCFVDYGPWMFV